MTGTTVSGPLVNTYVKGEDSAGTRKRNIRVTSTKRFLTAKLEQVVERVCMAKL